MHAHTIQSSSQKSETSNGDDALHDETFTFRAHSGSPGVSLTVQVRRSTARTQNFKLTVQVSRKDLYNSLLDFGGAPWSSSSDDDAAPADIDALGLDVWPAAITLSQFLVDTPEIVENKRVIELGAGVGLPGLVAAKVGSAESIITDYDGAVVGHCDAQIARCRLQHVARAAIVDWKKPADEAYREAFDVVLAADVLVGDAQSRRRFRSEHSLTHLSLSLSIDLSRST